MKEINANARMWRSCILLWKSTLMFPKLFCLKWSALNPAGKDEIEFLYDMYQKIRICPAKKALVIDVKF